MTAASLAFEELERRLHVTAWRGDTLDARCPAHDDRKASLSVSKGRHGGVVLHCHAGCQLDAILDAIGMTVADISAEPHIVAVYEYLDEAGSKLWDVERWEPKDFRVRPKLPPPSYRRLYHSEMLPKARRTKAPIFLVEGEKDADTLVKAGFVGVSAVSGAAAEWLPQYSEQLRDLDVIIIADADEPGRQRGRVVAKALDGIAATVSLTEPSYGKDVTDQLDAGYALDTLMPLPVDEVLGVFRVDRIRERKLTWVWPGYIPNGKMVIIEGDPGDGKSVMTCDLAARFSTGTPLPDGSKCPEGPVNVAMISAEDDPEDTIRPRLRVAGANLKKVWLISEGTIPGRPFDLGRDVAALEYFVRENNVRLVFIDPLMAFMPEGLNAYSDHEVRRAIHPLTSMAMRTGCSLVVVRHLTKGRTKAITAGGGSIAFIGAARVGFLVGEHPDDDSKRALSCVKVNVAAKPATLGYKIVTSETDPDLPRVRWDDAVLDVSAQEILDAGAEDGARTRADAKVFLAGLLDEHRSGLPWVDIVKKGKAEGHSEITLRRVRNSVGQAVRNPLGVSGTKMFGTFWLSKDAVPRFAADARVEGEKVSKPSSTLPPRVEPSSSVSLVGGCDICGEVEAVTFGSPYNVQRCVNHNPMMYQEAR